MRLTPFAATATIRWMKRRRWRPSCRLWRRCKAVWRMLTGAGRRRRCSPRWPMPRSVTPFRRKYFSEIIRGVESDLVKTRYRDFGELREYCYRVASVVGLVCLQIFQYAPQSGAAARERAADLGLAMQLTNIMRDVREDWDLGRVYLPQDEMARFGYSEEQLAEGVRNDAFVALLRFQGQRARGYFRSGFRLLPYLSRRSRGCPAALGYIYWRVLDRIEASGYDVLGQRRIGLSGSEKARIAARAWVSGMFSLPGLPG